MVMMLLIMVMMILVTQSHSGLSSHVTHVNQFSTEELFTRFAKALSAALYTAIDMMESGKVAVLWRPSPTVLRDDFNLAELSQVNSSVTGLLKGLANFASRGGFAFAWDD